ncbi:MAG: sigma factor [Armatimonadota bacterium]|nr:sigma factor [Armatimonadota bacterium]
MRDYTELDATADRLQRSAILGDKDALGDLLMLYRPLIRIICSNSLRKWRMESYAEDLTQDTILDAIRSWSTRDPTLGTFPSWIGGIARNCCLEFLYKNQVVFYAVPLPDNDTAEGDDEYHVDPLDGVAFHAWEQDSPSNPMPMANKFFIRKFSRAVTKERERKAKEKELQARPGSGNYRRDHRKKTVWEMKRIEKNRQAFASAANP